MKGHKVEAGSGLIDNLSSLTSLDEQSLLEEIRSRYHSDIIYTYIGDILVAVNPYKRILIFGPEHLDRYRDVKVRSDHPPHLYAVSDQAYQTMVRTGSSQCCVVSGESGAGKTESTKLMVQHIAHLCKHVNGHLHDRIIQVNPLLEAFGNAQTVMNNNSSRFGKYIELNFATDGRIMGAHISEYILEKSRVVGQGKLEKNFHVFYYIFAGLTPEQLKINLLNMPEDHRIMRSVGGMPIFNNEAEFHHYQEQWARLRDIMDVVGFLLEEVNMILALLAAILHITDIQFDNDYETEGVYILREEIMEIAAELLAVQPEEMAACFISNVTYLRGERIVSLKNIEQANDGRDALAKALYSRLFGWIVRQINFMLQPDRRMAEVGPSIGILDIAGFENFETNSFEQLCINAANEQLQFYFNQHIFQWELDEYKKEGVKGKDIKFVDNRPVIDLLLESPLGLFSLLDEESRFPQASDQTLLDKLTKNLAKKPQYQKPKSQPSCFNIVHYAGPVTYGVKGFLEKNRDTLSANLLECMKNSESQIVCDLFTAPISDTGALQMNPDGPKRSRKSLLLCKPKDFSYTKTRSLSKRAGKKLKEQKARKQAPLYETTLKTMGGHFKSSLTDLMGKLLECEPYFIRCLKPNSQKKSNLFEPKLVMEQLKYTGVLETVRIRRLGYPLRVPFHIFVERYRMLAFPLTQQVEPTNHSCTKILRKIGLKDWEIGKTKVFLKYWHSEQLILMLDRLGWNIVHCQRFIRGYLARKKYRGMAELARQDKAAVRGFCVYLANESDDRFYNLSRQKEHDTQRYNQMMADQEKQQHARIEQKHKLLEQKQALERERMAQRAISPVRHQQKPDRTRDLSPSSNAGLKDYYQPTPLLLGNPVYGTSKSPDGESFSSTGDFRPGLRRQGSKEDRKKPLTNYEYPTETMTRSPVAQQRNNFEFNNHLTRPSPVPTSAPKNSATFHDKILREAIAKLPNIESDVWAKVFYIERDQLVAKLYLRNDEVIIDSSSQQYDGYVIGLGAFEDDNPYRDSAIDKVREQIGKGVKLKRDADGSIYATKLTKANVIVKGHMDPTQHCISKEIIENMGRLTDKPFKIFDMKEYKEHISLELKRPSIDEARLHRFSIVSFSFVRNTFDDLDTPCWISIINLFALNALGQEDMLRDAQAVGRLNLREAEEQQLKRNWERLNLRPMNGHDGRSSPQGGRLSRADYSMFGGSTIQTERDQSPSYQSTIYGETNELYQRVKQSK